MNTTTNSRKGGRPESNKSRADESARPRERIPVDGNRDILTIAGGKDPAYHYRFVKDVADDGSRIMRFIDAGYELVTTEKENLRVGQNHIYKSDNNGSIIATKEGDGYLYLMKIRKEWYEEDQQAKEDRIAAKERDMKRARNSNTDDGMYGSNKISRKSLL